MPSNTRRDPGLGPPPVPFLACVLLAGVVFAVDLWIPTHYADGVLYVAVVLLTLRVSGVRATWLAAGLSTALAIAGDFAGAGAGAASSNLLPVLAPEVLVLWVVALGVVDRKRVETDLRRLGQVFRDAADPIVIEDLAGTVVDVNEAAERAYGWRRDELVGRPGDLVVPTSAREEDERFRERCREGKSVRNVESLRWTATGEIFPVLVTYSLLSSPEGAPLGIFSTWKDISALKRATREAEAARAQAEGVVETVHVPLVVLDRSLRLLAANPAFQKTFQHGGEQELGHPFDELAGGAWSRASLPERLRAVAQGQASFGGLEIETELPGIGRRIVLVSARPIPVPSLRRALVALEDITERREAENALVASETRLRNVLETAADGIVTVDDRGIVESFNPAAERMFGWRREEIVGRNVALLMPEPFSEQHDDFIRRYLQTGETRVIGIGREVLGRRKDGSEFPLEISLSVQESDGHQFTAILRDLTDRKQLEEEFLQAQKMEAIGRLAGGIAHDFNNLLMGVMSGCRIALNQLPADSPARPFLEDVIGETQKGSRLTRQLLDFSRKRSFTPRPIHLDEVILGAEKMVRKLIGEDIELSVEVAEKGLAIVADPGQIEQVLMNLVVNARDAMPGGGHLWIRLERSDGALLRHAGERMQAAARLSVRDNGAGMSEDVRRHAFEPFYTTKRVGEGTGLGLSTVYGIVKEFGGHIEIESAPGRGCTFHLEFPLSQAAVEREQVDTPPVEVEGGDETILVVEDERLVRASIRHLLESLGYRVLEAAGPEEALGLCEKEGEGIDLLLTDIVMPGLSGGELARRLQARFPGLRALFMSAFSGRRLVEEGRLEAGQPTLEKPFTQEELAAKVREVLSSG